MNKSKVGTTLGVLSILSVVVGFILVLYFFGMAAAFELLGVQYNSNWSLIVFVVSFFILGVIVELFTEAIFKLSVRNIIGKMKVLFIRISFESTSNWLVLFTVDEFMRSITLSLKMEVIIALLLAVLEMAFGDDEDKMSRGS